LRKPLHKVLSYLTFLASIRLKYSWFFTCAA
jgi:hypothetical protein